MLVTALNPQIGYDRAVDIGKLALAKCIASRRAAEKLGYLRTETTLPGAGA
jgi:fumarate hydratase, class II